jgi:predicted secreted hydrolase
VLDAERYAALEQWDLESWLQHPICAKGDVKSLTRYTPHFTMIWPNQKPADKAAREQMAEEWWRIKEDLEPIDPERIEVDRITLFVRDSSKKSRGYVRGSTIEIG